MLPGIAPGDWLLLDPTIARWPRRGSVVVFREPASDVLAVKRVAALPGDTVPFEGGFLHLGPDEAWLVADADPPTAAMAGFGPPIDSSRFGPVPLPLLVGRAWFRYGPVRRIGMLRRIVPRLARPPPSELQSALGRTGAHACPSGCLARSTEWREVSLFRAVRTFLRLSAGWR